jgi:protein-tyrosine-phosphatase
VFSLGSITIGEVVSAIGLEAKMHRKRPVVLFVCVHNAGRSQVAAAFTRDLSQGGVEVRSAGSLPASEINPTVVQAMREEVRRLGAG